MGYLASSDLQYPSLGTSDGVRSNPRTPTAPVPEHYSSTVPGPRRLRPVRTRPFTPAPEPVPVLPTGVLTVFPLLGRVRPFTD